MISNTTEEAFDEPYKPFLHKHSCRPWILVE